MAGFLMLASPADDANIKFPVYASPKLDGIRASIEGGKLLTRSAKPLPNDYIRSVLEWPFMEQLDGELIVGPSFAEDVYQVTSSSVMKKSGTPDFRFHVFDDRSDESLPFQTRLDLLSESVWKAKRVLFNAGLTSAHVELLDQVIIYNAQELDEYEVKCLEKGYEGVMIRSPDGKYKRGRSTAKGGELNKLKRFEHDEALIIGYEELMHNGNEAFLDELGRTKRSSIKEGLTNSGLLGSYIVEQEKYEKPFKISCGSMKADERKKAWEERETSIGKLARYKFFPKGMKDVPRHGLWAGFRDPIDLS